MIQNIIKVINSCMILQWSTYWYRMIDTGSIQHICRPVFCNLNVTVLRWSGPLFGPNYSQHAPPIQCFDRTVLYTQLNKNPSAWYFLNPELEVTWHTVAILIWVILLSPYLCICGVSLSSIHYNQSHCVYINRRQQYICLIWN